MADTFISYSQKDRLWVKQLVDALAAEGWSAWWDLKIRAGESFDQVIETELGKVRCVLVTWSRHSVKSEWVRAEAAWAKDRNRLVSMRIQDDVQLPLKFYHVHTASMTNWNGSRYDPAFRSLVADIRDIVGLPPSPETTRITVTKSPAALKIASEQRLEFPSKQEPSPPPKAASATPHEKLTSPKPKPQPDPTKPTYTLGRRGSFFAAITLVITTVAIAIYYVRPLQEPGNGAVSSRNSLGQNQTISPSLGSSRVSAKDSSTKALEIDPSVHGKADIGNELGESGVAQHQGGLKPVGSRKDILNNLGSKLPVFNRRTATEIVRDVWDGFFTAMKEHRAEVERDPSLLQSVVDPVFIPHFDFGMMTRAAVGKHWSKATPAQRKALTAGFQQVLVRILAKHALNYSNQEIRCLPEKPGPRSTIVVPTEVLEPGSDPIQIDYKFYEKGSNWKIYDVKLDGLSLVENYRGSFASRIRQVGIESLITDLNEMNGKSAASRAEIKSKRIEARTSPQTASLKEENRESTVNRAQKESQRVEAPSSPQIMPYSWIPFGR